MSRSCIICHKAEIRGNSVQTKGVAKKKGGIGKHTTSITRRTFKPNLQKVTTLVKGKPKKVLICTKCLKKNKVTKI